MRVEVRPGTVLRAVNRSTWIAAGYRYNATDCCYPPVLNFEDVSNVSLGGGGVVDGDGGSGNDDGNASSWWQWTWSDKTHAE